jgi:hypothetical protein
MGQFLGMSSLGAGALSPRVGTARCVYDVVRGLGASTTDATQLT